MIKKLAIGCLALALLLGLCACGSRDNAADGSPAYKDGTYTAESDYEDGWKDVVSITIEDGRITEVDWNAFNPEGGDKKTLSKNGAYDMVAGGAKSQWFEQAASMEMALVNEQKLDNLTVKNDGKTDAVSGVTMKVNPFVTLAQKALEQAKA